MRSGRSYKAVRKHLDTIRERLVARDQVDLGRILPACAPFARILDP
jgi:hypothetical protein